MKGLIIAALSTLVLGSFTTSVLADEMAALGTENYLNQVQPVNLVSLAYQGYFRDQGIPDSLALAYAVKTGRIDAETLVNVAIKQGRLSPDTINDNGYLFIVQTELNDLYGD